jgi:hypothetical protein
VLVVGGWWLILQATSNKQQATNNKQQTTINNQQYLANSPVNFFTTN